MPFERAYPPAEAPAGPAHWFLVARANVVVREAEPGTIAIPFGTGDDVEALAPRRTLFLGLLDGVPCLGAEVRDEVLPAGYESYPLAPLATLLDAATFALAGYAFQLVRWARKGRHCTACGAELEPLAGEWGRRCPACRHVAYPPVNPCVIGLVHDGADRVLLTHRESWGSMHALVAGFVEPGESLEECLARELREEVGVEIAAVEYHGSQPWPFPHQLMIGFFARYAGGEIVVDRRELDGAAWYALDALPDLPPAASIARRLVDAWAERRRAARERG